MFRKAAILATIVGLSLGQPYQHGTETQLNSQWNSVNAKNNDVTHTGDGTYIVTWEDNGVIRVGRYLHIGTPLYFPPNWQANANGGAVTNAGSFPCVCWLSNGGYVVAWASNGQDTDGFGVYAQIFDVNSIMVGTEFQVNTYVTSDQGAPQCAGLTGGGFVIVWYSNGQDGSGSGIYAQMYTTAGAAVGTEFRVNTYVSSQQDEPQVIELGTGGFVVTWRSIGQDGDQGGIFAQIYSSTGAAVGSEFQVNSISAGSQDEPEVNKLTNGDFIVTWGTDDSSGRGIAARRFSGAGVPVGNEFLVNTQQSGNQLYPAIAGMQDGGWVSTWTGTDANIYGVFCQFFNSAGVKIGAEVQVNTNTQNLQFLPTAAGLQDNRVVIVWDSRHTGSYNVMAQRLQMTAPPTPPPTPIPSNAPLTGAPLTDAPLTNAPLTGAPPPPPLNTAPRAKLPLGPVTTPQPPPTPVPAPTAVVALPAPKDLGHFP